MLVEQSVKGFIDVLASDAPAPGGGSVAALSGSLGAALVAMVCRLTQGKKGYEAAAELMASVCVESDRLHGLLTESVDSDTQAFNGVMAAFKMPKGTDDEKKARSAAIQAGYKEAIQSPLQIARNCLEAERLAAAIVKQANTNALSDVGVGVMQAYTGLLGALMNVNINLPSIKDTVFAERIAQEAEKLSDEGKKICEEVVAYVNQAIKQ